jgi:dTDP-4-amino-4,6-dideoxygalactose transaminase
MYLEDRQITVRDAVAQALRDAGVACAIYYPKPLYRQPVFADDAAGVHLPVAEDISKRCLSLPMYPELTESQIDTVITAVRSSLGR